VHAPLSLRALCAPSAGVGSDMWAGSARLGPRQAKPSGFVAGPHRSSARCACGPSSVSALKPFKNLKFIFYFIQFQTEFKLQKLYLNI
jgi:hypothetical protein